MIRRRQRFITLAAFWLLATSAASCSSGNNQQPDTTQDASDDSGTLKTDVTTEVSQELLTESDVATSETDSSSTPQSLPRIPGEWEEQAAVWMQWPTKWEASLRPDFGRIIAVVQQYEPVHLLVLNDALEGNARTEIKTHGGDPDDVAYHVVPYDNSWLRDNGPVYVEGWDGLEVQDWGFDAWGGNFGAEIQFAQDDAVPAAIAELTGLSFKSHNSYILERGNLESNGVDTLILGWDCQEDRNPDWSKAKTERLFLEIFGAQKVIWVHGHDPADGTTGHIDGIVRFVDEGTVAVARSLIPDDPFAQLMDDAANTLAHSGFTVVRLDVPGLVKHKGVDLPAMYMNWLVGNGFVAAMAFGNQQWDDNAKASLEQLYPDRDVHMIDTNELWLNGGGIHCVTNDQPQE